MSGNVSGHPTSNSINSASDTVDPARPARELATQLGVRFAEIDLPDTPENNRIKRPSTRRWTRGWAVLDLSDDKDEDETESEQEDGEEDEDLDAESQDSEIAFRSNDTNVSEPAASQRPSNLSCKRMSSCADV